jgi:hypothetical protein
VLDRALAEQRRNGTTDITAKRHSRFA